MLRSKQQRFVNEYLVDFNATQAAIRAGYSPHTARAIGSENLKKPAIAAAVAGALARRRRKFDANAARTVEALSRIAFASIKGLYGPHGEILPPEKWPPEPWDAVKSFSYRKTRSKSPGTPQQPGFRASIRMHDKLRALEALGQYLGMFGPKAK